MPHASFSRIAILSLIAGGVLTAIFAGLLIRFRSDLRSDIQAKIIERDAAVLYPMALLQIAESQSNLSNNPSAAELLSPILRSSQQSGMIGVTVFDADGDLVRAVPATLLFPDLALNDYLKLATLQPISRYHPAFRLDQTFAGVGPTQHPTPVLEVLVPLHHPASTELLGVARYLVDARSLAGELTSIDRQINRQTAATIAIAAALIGIVVSPAYLGLTRAQRLIAERNERLLRANFELTLSAKASALGQITSHLIHGLQGPVAGLRAMVAARVQGTAYTSSSAIPLVLPAPFT